MSERRSGVAVVLALLGVGALSWWLPSGVFASVLRLALGLGVASSCGGVALGWLIAWGTYTTGVSSVRWVSRGGEVVLALPWLWFLALVAQSWRGEGRFFLAFALLQATRSALWLLGAAKGLEVEPFLEGARAIGARRGRIFSRHLGPWMFPTAARLAAEGAAVVVPLDLLLSLLGVGSGLQSELARAALEGQRRGDLWLTCALAAALGLLFLALPGRLVRSRAVPPPG